jgi:ABC-2 type transport system permease protein
MAASVAAEIIKLGRRPATWVVGAVFLGLIVFFGYFLSYVFIVGIQDEAAPETQQFVATLYPENFLINVLSNGFVGFGSALALVLGALAVGSEYGWGTFKTSLTQRPGRMAVFSGKLLALAGLLAVLTLPALATGALSSLVVAAAEDVPANWPAAPEVLRAAGTGWFILVSFAAMGAFFATLFRGPALAIALGLVYLLVLENLFLGFPTENETFVAVGKALPARNATDLVAAFGDPFGGFEPPGGTVEPAQALLVLGAYTLGFVVLSLLLFHRRDVT